MIPETGLKAAASTSTLTSGVCVRGSTMSTPGSQPDLIQGGRVGQQARNIIAKGTTRYRCCPARSLRRRVLPTSGCTGTRYRYVALGLLCGLKTPAPRLAYVRLYVALGLLCGPPTPAPPGAGCSRHAGLASTPRLPRPADVNCAPARALGRVCCLWLNTAVPVPCGCGEQVHDG